MEPESNITRYEFDLFRESVRERFNASEKAVQLALASVIRPQDKADSKSTSRAALLVAIVSTVISILLTVYTLAR